ncbi:MAG: YdeI/OmpD-associated family protein [Bacteroidota bacterium]
MAFSFTATIYKVGMNPCVAVPFRITGKLVARKGYIAVKGKINQHAFVQNLVPVKNEEYRLYLNGPILKGAGIGLGDTVKIFLEQDTEPEKRDPSVPPALQKRLGKEGLQKTFDSLTYYRRKEILKYLGFLKTEESLQRNIEKIVRQLKEQ